ncbi:MAG: 4-hydroxyphenylpyruvate dioxygenase [bacterium]
MFRGIDHVEFYVGNAFASSYFYARALGFVPHAEAGLETGHRDRHSCVVAQNGIHLVFTNPLKGSGPIADHVRKHGDAIRDIAIAVDDADEAFRKCVAFGAEPVEEPRTESDKHGEVRRATIATFGDTVHSLIERKDYSGTFLPGYRDWLAANRPLPGNLMAIDHVACCVERGSLRRWVEFYEKAFGFREVHHEDIVTDRSAMNSIVIGSENGAIKFPLMEPAPAKGKSQIEEFLDYNEGAGGQHLAFLSEDILQTVRSLQADGWVAFLETPGTYYDALPDRVGEIEEDFRELDELNVLVDRDAWGYLLQVFTRPVTGKPTSFLEIVQRKGARGFGGGNVRALFEAVERAQAARGNL